MNEIEIIKSGELMSTNIKVDVQNEYFLQIKIDQIEINIKKESRTYFKILKPYNTQIPENSIKLIIDNINDNINVTEGENEEISKILYLQILDKVELINKEFLLF